MLLFFLEVKFCDRTGHYFGTAPEGHGARVTKISVAITVSSTSFNPLVELWDFKGGGGAATLRRGKKGDGG